LDAAKDLDAVKQGMNLIYSRFNEFLSQNGIREIESLNREFTTDLHEAVTKIPAPEENLKGKVVEVIEKGYYLHDKVIRYPKVVVGE
jgi:molecular chaperone GrpE